MAKCLEYKESTLLTDDFAIQNLSNFLGINIQTVTDKKKIKSKIIWNKKCIGCKKIYPSGEICLICGSKLIKNIKNKVNFKN